MQICHVRRRSLLRFNGCIKLIQIYILLPRETRTNIYTRVRTRRCPPPGPGRGRRTLRRSMATPPVSRSRFTPRGCGFIIPPAEREDPDTKGTTRCSSFSPERIGGAADRARDFREAECHSRRMQPCHDSPSPDIMERPDSRPDFRPIPRRGAQYRDPNAKGFTVASVRSENSWESRPCAAQVRNCSLIFRDEGVPPTLIKWLLDCFLEALPRGVAAI